MKNFIIIDECHMTQTTPTKSLRAYQKAIANRLNKPIKDAPIVVIFSKLHKEDSDDE